MKKSTPKPLTAFLLLVLAVWPGAGVRGQGGLFFDAVDVQIVNVEVIVTDAEGRPIRGLTAADFEVFEDGEAVDVTNFYAIERGAPAAREDEVEAAAANLQISLPPVYTECLQLVILVDDANTDLRNRRRVLAKLEEFLPERWRKEDRVMLVRLDETVEIVHPFTHSVEEVLYLLEGLGKRQGSAATFDAEYQSYLSQLERAVLAPPPDPATFGGTGNVDSQALNRQREFESAVEDARRLAQQAVSLAERWQQRLVRSKQALSEFVVSLAALPGRKAVVLVSDGLPVRSNSIAEAWVAKYENWIFSLPGFTTFGPGQQDLHHEMTQLRSSRFYSNIDLDSLITEASANQVVFYPLSSSRPGGGTISAEYAGSGSGAGGGPRSFQVADLERTDRESSLLRLASGTGGFAYTNTANVADLIQRLTRDFDDFYSLGYRLDREADEELHKIDVKVRREGAKVRHLKTYRGKTEVGRLSDLVVSLLHYEAGDNTLGVRLEAGAPVKIGRGRYQVPIQVAIPFSSLLLLPEADQHVGQLAMVIGARDEQGNSSPMRHIELPIRIPNDRLDQVLAGGAFYPFEMVMDKGRQLVAIAIRDRLAKITATVRFELNVDDETGG